MKIGKTTTLIFACLVIQCFFDPALAGILLERGIEPLDIRNGARPLGMGLAYVGVCQDSNALFFNPAGIARTKGITLTLKDINNFAASDVFSTDYGMNFGLGIVRSLAKGVEYPSGSADISSSILVGSLGSRLGFISDMFSGWDMWRSVDVGLDVKYLLDQSLREEGVGEISAKGWNADFGLLFRVNDWAKVGVVLENFLSGDSGPGILAWDSGEAEEIGTKTKIGVGLKIIGDRRSPFYLKDNELTLASDVVLRSDDPATLISLGAEWAYAGTYFLRAGTRSDVKEGKAVSSFTAGTGARFGYWGFDIAYNTDYLTDEPAYYFSFLYWPGEWVFVSKPRQTKVPAKVSTAEAKVAPPTKVATKEGKAVPPPSKTTPPKEKTAPLPPSVVSPPPAKEEVVKEEGGGELIKIIGMEEEIVTDEDVITVKGLVLRPGAKVFINGNQVATEDDGSFSAELPLSVGKNLVEITTEYGGSKKTIKRKVLRKERVTTPMDVKLEEKIEKEIKPVEEEIAVKEGEIKAKEATVGETEEKVKTLEKKPLSEDEKKALEAQKKMIGIERRALEEERARVEDKKQKLYVEKKKIEGQKKEIKKKKAAVEDLATLGIIDIAPDKVYETEEPISRGELASWLARAKNLPSPTPVKAPFPDVPADHMYAPYIKAVSDRGLMKPFGDGTFRPDRTVTEKEGMEIFKRFTGNGNENE